LWQRLQCKLYQWRIGSVNGNTRLRLWLQWLERRWLYRNRRLHCFNDRGAHGNGDLFPNHLYASGKRQRFGLRYEFPRWNLLRQHV